jgi:hypothetical protein
LFVTDHEKGVLRHPDSSGDEDTAGPGQVPAGGGGGGGGPGSTVDEVTGGVVDLVDVVDVEDDRGSGGIGGGGSQAVIRAPSTSAVTTAPTPWGQPMLEVSQPPASAGATAPDPVRSADLQDPSGAGCSLVRWSSQSSPVWMRA